MHAQAQFADIKAVRDKEARDAIEAQQQLNLVGVVTALTLQLSPQLSP